MAKLSRKEKEKIEHSVQKEKDRGPTFVGFRPAVFEPKDSPKRKRAKSKQECRNYGDDVSGST